MKKKFYEKWNKLTKYTIPVIAGGIMAYLNPIIAFAGNKKEETSGTEEISETAATTVGRVLGVLALGCQIFGIFLLGYGIFHLAMGLYSGETMDKTKTAGAFAGGIFLISLRVIMSYVVPDITIPSISIFSKRKGEKGK